MSEQEHCYVCGACTDCHRILIDVPTAVSFCKVSRSTLYRWMADDKLDWVRLPMGRRRIYLDSVFDERLRRLDALSPDH